MPRFIDAYNERFAKDPRDKHDAHRALRADEDLDFVFAWRELRKVTEDLTVHYRRKGRFDRPGNDRRSVNLDLRIRAAQIGYPLTRLLW